MKTQQGSIAFIILFIVAVLGIGGGTYYITKIKSPVEPVTITPVVLDPNRPMLRNREDIITSTSTPIVTVYVPNRPHTITSPTPTTPTQNTNTNSAPVIFAIPTQSVKVNEQVRIVVQAFDADNDPLTYSVENLNSSASFNASSRTFSWRPSSEGSYMVIFKVSDGKVSTFKTAGIEVNPQTNTSNPNHSNTPTNSAPSITTSSNQQGVLNQLLQFTITATDPDNDSLTYSAEGLPSGASFSPSTRRFSWTPATAGVYAVDFKVFDGRLQTTRTMTITVSNPVNRAPVLTSISNKSVNKNATLTFTITGTDPDNDPVTFTAENVPTGATFTSSTRTFTWTPSTTGTYNVTFKVSDGQLIDSQNVSITVISQIATPVAPKNSNFKIYDAYVRYPGMPRPFHPQSQNAYVGYRGQFFKYLGNDSYDVTIGDETVTKSYVMSLPQNATYVIDIENWPVNIYSSSEAAVLESIGKYQQIIGWIRSVRPDLKIGIYGVLPIRTYWTVAEYYRSPNHPPYVENYRKWKEANTFLMPLAQSVDYIFPSLYTFYEDRPGWVLYAQENIKEAKKYGKPIYPFIWPLYHDGAEPTSIRNTAIPTSFMRLQYDTLKNAGTNGFVIWGDEPNNTWGPPAWFTELVDFMNDNNIGSTHSSNSAKYYNDMEASAYSSVFGLNKDFWIDLYLTELSLITLYVVLRIYGYKRDNR